MIPAVEKYLARYAEPEIRIVRGLSRLFGHVIVIPAFDETEYLFRTLESIPKGPAGDVLTVLVINAPANSPPAVHSRSAQLGSEGQITGIPENSGCLHGPRHGDRSRSEAARANR